MNQLLVFLSRTPLFDGFTVHELKMIIPLFKKHYVKKNDFLYKKEDPSLYLYLVLIGEFHILSYENEDKLTLKSIALPLDILGEENILTQSNRLTNAIAALDSEVLMIRKRDFFKMLGMFPKLCMNIARVEATKINHFFTNTIELKSTKKIYLHNYLGTNIESSIMGLNLAVAMQYANSKLKIAYLHFGDFDSSPFALLKINISENKLLNSLNELSLNENVQDKKWLVKHNSGLWFLPTKLPLEETIKSEDYSRLLSTLSLSFDYIFINISSSNLNQDKYINLFKQIDDHLLGVPSGEETIEFMKERLSFLEKHVLNFDQKVNIYVNYLSCKYKEFLTEEDAQKFESIFSFEDNEGVEINLVDRLSTLFKHSSTVSCNINTNTIKDKKKKDTIISKIENIQFILNYKVYFSLKGKEYNSFSNNLALKSNHTSNDSNSYLSYLNLAGRKLINNTIGVAIGGGAARALSSLGVLKVLKESGIIIDSICGTSMGALVGASYLFENFNIEKTKAAFSKYLPTDKSISDYGLPQQGFFKGKKIEKLLQNYFQDTLIEDLPIPFSCVATDLITGKQYIFDKGPLWQAIRASISIPVVFPPFEHNNTFFIDGAAINNVPGDVVRNQGVKYVIGINSTPIHDNDLGVYLRSLNEMSLNLMSIRGFFKKTREAIKLFMVSIKRPAILGIANRAMIIEGTELLRTKQHNFDYLLNIDVSNFGLFDFHKRDDLIQCGVEQTLKNIALIKKSIHL